MQEQLVTFAHNIIRRMPEMDFAGVIEIIIVSFLIYEVLNWIKKTRAWALLRGLIVILAFWLLAYYFKMNTILWLGNNLIGFAVTALIVVMQPELRKALEELGNKEFLSNVLPFLNMRKSAKESFSMKTINEIARACVEMGKVKTGALIVVEGDQPLSDLERTGIDVDGLVTSQLLVNIFEKNTPLHDGAVIVRGNRVASATCYLPLSDNMHLDKNLGTRHRAGLGVSEVSDAVTVIVSEETGKISVAYKGELYRGLDADKLKDKLKIALPLSDGESKKTKLFRGRSKAEKVESTKKD